MRRFVLVAVLVGIAATARAHVAPSMDDNNRYLKLTPLGRVPDWLSVGAGKPRLVTVNDPAEPTVKVVLLMTA